MPATLAAHNDLARSPVDIVICMAITSGGRNPRRASNSTMAWLRLPRGDSVRIAPRRISTCSGIRCRGSLVPYESRLFAVRGLLPLPRSGGVRRRVRAIEAP
jgi:hypothetical protein